MSPSDTRLPQITGSPRDTVEVTSRASTAARSGVQSIEAQANPAPSVEFQLRQIQTALNEERALRQQQAAEATGQVERMRRELEEIAEARAAGPGFWHNFATHVMAPVGVVAVVVGILGFLALHPGSPNPRSAPHPAMAAEPAIPRAAPAPILPAEESLDPSPQKYEMARLNGAIQAVGDNDIPTMMDAVNQWLRLAGAAPCWVTSPSGSISLVISDRDPEHPLLSALARCADAVEHVTGQ
jgi:hypothetical protein